MRTPPLQSPGRLRQLLALMPPLFAPQDGQAYHVAGMDLQPAPWGRHYVYVLDRSCGGCAMLEPSLVTAALPRDSRRCDGARRPAGVEFRAAVLHVLSRERQYRVPRVSRRDGRNDRAP